MHPILFTLPDWLPLLGGMEIYTYGLTMALGFLMAFVLAYQLTRKTGEDLEFYMDLYLWIIIFGVVGAKLLYIIVDWQSFLQHPWELLNPRSGGLVWYGGMITVIVMIYFYTKHHGKSFLRVTDMCSGPMALGLGIGRWGCLMGGCCYGMACDPDFIFAITYPQGLGNSEIAGIPVHPAPIYASVNCLILAALCYLIVTRSKRQGLATYFALVYYPLTRSLLEFIRGDVHRGFLFQGESFALSTSQFISLLVLIPSFYMLVQVLRKPLPEPEPEPKKQAPVKTPAKEKKKKIN